LGQVNSLSAVETKVTSVKVSPKNIPCKTIVGFKSSIKTSKDCKKAKCLSCGDIKVARGIPIIPIAMCDIYDFGLHYKLLSKLSREERVSLICRISLN